MNVRALGWLGALTAGALALSATPGFAQSAAQGPYVSGGLGLSIPTDSSVEGTGLDTEADLDRGWMAMLGIGHAYGNGFRTEFEINRHENDVDSVGGVNSTGEVNTWGLMANVYYDIPTGWRFRPFIGAGIGGARVKADSVAPLGATSLNDSDWGLAWQATAGVAYALSQNLDATLAYRYFSVPDLDFTANSGASVESDYSSHNIMVGLRYTFGAPARRPEPTPAAAPAPQPPPPPAAAAPAQPPTPPIARNYLVFFDWNSANLTDQARGILQTAAENAKRTSPVRIRATGHADRSGTDAYNLRLSQRRANAVRAELVRLGVPANEISVVARGEREPLVATADGVREAQNRRVEIVLE